MPTIAQIIEALQVEGATPASVAAQLGIAVGQVQTVVDGLTAAAAIAADASRHERDAVMAVAGAPLLAAIAAAQSALASLACRVGAGSVNLSSATAAVTAATTSFASF